MTDRGVPNQHVDGEMVNDIEATSLTDACWCIPGEGETSMTNDIKGGAVGIINPLLLVAINYAADEARK